MAVTVDQVHLPVVVHIVAEDRKPAVTQLPFRKPFPFVSGRIDVAKPSVNGKDVGLPITVHVRHTTAVPVLVTTTELVSHRLRATKADPKKALASVMCGEQLVLAVAIHIRLDHAFGISRVTDEVGLPHLPSGLRVLKPPYSVVLPRRRDEIERAVVVHVDGKLGTVRDVLRPERLVLHCPPVRKGRRDGRDLAVLVALPFSPTRPGILVPVGTAAN